MLDALICPACSHFRESPLQVRELLLVCSNIDCHQSYQIVGGIPRLLTKSGDFLMVKEIDEYAPAHKNPG